MDDIAPELLERIRQDFNNAYTNSEKITSLLAKVKAGRATYAEANEYAVELGEILASAYNKNITSAVLPDGQMYYNIAKRIIEPTMSNNYNLIADTSMQVQKSLNGAAGIGIKAIKPELNSERISGIINRISSEAFENVKWLLDEPVKNFSQSVVDDSIKANSEFHGKAGLAPQIVRKLSGGCCEWCARLAGKYTYPDVPQDVYRRHQRCRCTVEYDPGSGKVQNVHSKQWSSKSQHDKMAAYAEQNYLPVRGTEILNLFDKKMGEIELLKIDGYSDVYVQNGVHIKPMALYNINQNIESAIKDYNGNRAHKPKIAVVDKEKLGRALGKYDCVENVMYVVPELGDKKSLSAFTVLDKNISFGSTEYHECWHWMQAQKYGKVITEETRYTEYMPWLLEKSRNNIEKLGINEYNIYDISGYAKDSFRQGRYDEVEAEYYVKKFLNIKR